MKKILITSIVFMLASFTFSAQAGGAAGAQFSTLDGFNAPDNQTVSGVRLSILHGKTQNVKGLDMTLLAISEMDNFVGLSFPFGIGATRINNSMTGVAVGLVNMHKGQDTGLNMGFVNMTNNVKGANIGTVNYSTGDTTFDMSAVNISQASTVQIGVFNKTKNLKGLQIGLINFAENGFFPFFPFFNFGTSK